MSVPVYLPINGDRLLAALRQVSGCSDLSFIDPPYFLAKGAEATIDAFRLENAPAGMDGPLIVRRLHKDADPRQLIFERAVHRAFETSSFPVPRVLYLESDASVLDHPFLIAERVAGNMLLGDIMEPGKLSEHPGRVPGLIHDAVFRVPVILADTLANLHQLDPAMLRDSLCEFGLSPDDISFDRHLEKLAERVASGSMAELREGITWLEASRPCRGLEVICHGDLLFTNLFTKNGKLTGVFDWSNASLAEPSYDVAATVARLRSHLPDMPRWLAPIVKPLQRWLTWRLIRRYTRRSGAKPEHLRYYEAYWILAELASATLKHGSGERFDGSLETRWLHPATFEAGKRDFERLTGVTLAGKTFEL